MWLAGAEDRPYSSAYAPHHWRCYPDFGAGAIGDMACHILGTPNMAIRLTAPISGECSKQEGRSVDTFAKKNVMGYDFHSAGARRRENALRHDGQC